MAVRRRCRRPSAITLRHALDVGAERGAACSPCARSRGRGGRCGRQRSRPRRPGRRSPGSPRRAGRSPSPCAPCSCSTPCTIAVLPSTSMSAPRRSSSCTCMKRFSKIVSVIMRRAVGDAVERHELRLHVGREAGIRRGAQAHRAAAAVALRSRIAVVAVVDLRAGLAQLVEHRVEGVRRGAAQRDVAAGRRPRRTRKVPVSMRSGMTRCAAPCSALDALDA